MTGCIERLVKTSGRLRLELNQRRFAGHGRIALLRLIGETGSIAQAARALGMSYKQAWDAVDAMNNLAPTPLVRRQSGGRGGGGSELTEEGRRLIALYEIAEREHRRFIERLNQRLNKEFDHLQGILEALTMKFSARNVLRGTVSAIKLGPVNAEVRLDINGLDLIAVITNDSVQRLGLEVGREALALIKASFIILAAKDAGLKTSARNRFCGTVERLTQGAVSSEVVLALDNGIRLTAIITNDSVSALDLAIGKPACALIKASHVVLAVND